MIAVIYFGLRSGPAKHLSEYISQFPRNIYSLTPVLTHIGSLLDFALRHGPLLLRCEGRPLKRRLDFGHARWRDSKADDHRIQRLIPGAAQEPDGGVIGLFMPTCGHGSRGEPIHRGGEEKRGQATFQMVSKTVRK